MTNRQVREARACLDKPCDQIPSCIEAQLGIWHDVQQFFRVGGRRDWASLLDASDLAHFEARLDELAGDAAPWILNGRAAL